MTSQARDFDADLDFDRFLLTGFFEAGAPTMILSMSSSFNGFSEIGLALAITHWSFPLFPTSLDKPVAPL